MDIDPLGWRSEGIVDVDIPAEVLQVLRRIRFDSVIADLKKFAREAERVLSEEEISAARRECGIFEP